MHEEKRRGKDRIEELRLSPGESMGCSIAWVRVVFLAVRPKWRRYTSGSTGAPKGVMIRHGGLASYVLATRRDLALTPSDRMLSEEIRDKLGVACVIRFDPMTKEEIASVRLRTAFDLFTAGERMMRQNLRRRHPDASATEIEEMLWAWLMHRPGAEYGDGVGRPVTWPRKASQAG